MAKERKFVFTSTNVAEIVRKQSEGINPPRHMNPWFRGEVGVRKANLVFGWTDHEIQEFTKCATDIHYFANNYCKIKREDGTVGQMTLRDYQYDILETYTKSRFVLNMSSRQTGD